MILKKRHHNNCCRYFTASYAYRNDIADGSKPGNNVSHTDAFIERRGKRAARNPTNDTALVCYFIPVTSQCAVRKRQTDKFSLQAFLPYFQQRISPVEYFFTQLGNPT